MRLPLAFRRLAATLLPWMAWLLPALTLAATQATEIHLLNAGFQPLGGTEWREVTLPHNWVQDGGAQGHSPAGDARYRLHFELPPPDGTTLAVRFDRLSSVHRMALNGEPVSTRGTATDKTDGRGEPVLALLPPHALRAGPNTLDIEVHHSVRGGLSTAWIGPADLLEPAHAALGWRTVTLPQALNLAAAAMALFMLVIWSRRRSEVALGSFGALMLVGSLRNVAYGAGLQPLPRLASDWVFFAAQTGSMALFGAFAVAFAGLASDLRWRRYVRGLAAVALLLSAGAAVLPPVDRWRAVAYPLMLASALPALAIVGRTAWREGGFAMLGLSGFLLAVFGALAHDYLFQQGHLPITHIFWVPYVMPLALATYAAVLAHRLVGALSVAEHGQQQLEARVADRMRELEASNLAKTRFLAAASHDLRQPVVAIGLLVGMVRERVRDAGVHSMLERASEAVGALEELLRGLLDLSRLDSGTVVPKAQPVALGALFASIDLHEQGAAAGKGLRLRFRGAQLAVRSDPVLLEQIMRNLVGNAVRYTDRGGVLVTARARGTDRVLLQVWDSGRGIPPAHQQSVFEEFVQIDNPERDRRKGLGLGLAIVQRGVSLLGHRLTLRSRVGHGTCFSIDLPRERRITGERPRPATADQPLGGWNLWLLEDEPTVRDALVSRLQAWGAQVHACGRLADLRMALREGSTAPDVLLTDHRLSDGDGLEAVALVRGHHGPTPALIVTGDTAPDQIALFKRRGVPVLHKPFSAEALLAQLRAVGGPSPG